MKYVNLLSLKNFIKDTKVHLTPDACALMGNVVLQIKLKDCLSAPLANTPIVHQEESLAAVVQTVCIMCCVLDKVTSWETSLQTSNTRIQWLPKQLFSCWVL